MTIINLSKDNPIWLVPEEKLNYEFRKAVRLVLQVYKKTCGNAKGGATTRVEAAFRYGIDFKGWKFHEFELLLKSTFRKSEIKLGHIDRKLHGLPSSYDEPLSQFFRVVFIALWARKVFIAPLSIQTINHLAGSFDLLCETVDLECLTIIRGVHPQSRIESIFKRDEFNNGSSRVNFWLRLLLSTNFYNVEDITEEGCKILFDGANGSGELPLRRYYVNDFLLTITSSSPAKKKMVEGIVNQYQDSKRKNTVAKVYKGRRVAQKKDVKTTAQEAHEIAYKMAQTLANGEVEFDFEPVFKTHFQPYRMKGIFSLGEDGDRLPFVEASHPQVKNFAIYIDGVFRSFMRSKRLQKSSGYTALLSIFMSYVTMYLPGFYMRRDGSLENYPRTINDFTCTLYFTRESVFLDGVNKFEKQPPRTFLAYLEAYARAHGWGNDTHYARVLVMDHFCQYIEDNKLALPDADQFKCNFTSACYPPVERRVGTVKKPIPRVYFATFLSMLYSLEYLTDHINNMPYYEEQDEKDINYGVLNGKLYQPTMAELQNSHAWAGLYTREARGFGEVNQSLLNYTPIFYHEQKIYRFEILPRFYKVVDFEFNGQIVQRISPNSVRLTILMCETGLRQQHLIWLNKDKYDCVFDRYWDSPLAPLFVSSDKSHSEWTAIVSRHVIDVMDRQKAWYESCSDPAYQEDLWYGFTKGSKFGKFKPLFRDAGKGTSYWANYRHFPVYLLMLQHFIKEVIGDDTGKDLVFLKSADEKNKPIAGYDNVYLSSLSVDELTSPHTPHGLRAGFVSEAMRFLPPSLIGQFMTGQTEQLVWYYTIFDGENMPDHQKLLADYMLKNMDKLSGGDAPELAAAALRLNARLADSIRVDPVKAIETHGMISLTGVKAEDSGLEVLRAKRYTKLAYNNCHICPFDNRCPKEVIQQIGAGRPCALCPYAIRGVDHLPAISAEKDKSKEVMKEVMGKLREWRALKPASRNAQDAEKLNEEYDRYAREAYALEVIEHQLYRMAKSGDFKSYFLPEKDGLVAHFEKVNVTEAEHVLKRLIDVQNFPDASSESLNQKFAYMRMAMLMNQGKFDELLRVDPRPPSHQLSSQISSMMTAGVLDVRDVIKIGHAASNPPVLTKPGHSISATLGIEKLAKESSDSIPGVKIA
ncbi:hypothetical protein [Pseudomonas asiatica]|uniref:hypothetical protein n=1 Tax=Pseudomonas asiatica TaxID=2219225 RepID=UPI0018D850B4|nr:hypothetical protein [Pseudomonas asiatica]MBH3379630.1 hypothetical protein [Pseudomonas asiatica]